MSPWTFQVGLNITMDEMWADVMSRHQGGGGLYSRTMWGGGLAGLSVYLWFYD
jgi:hypothetical protein